MGTTTMLTANGPLYRHVQGLDFRVLMYLAQITYDEEHDGFPARTYLGGLQKIVLDMYGYSPDDSRYASTYRRIQRSIANLVDSGAIRRTVLATKRGRAHYEICPLQGALVADLKAALKKPGGTTFGDVPPALDDETTDQGGTTFGDVRGTTFGDVRGTTFGDVRGTTFGDVPNERTQLRTQLRTQPEELLPPREPSAARVAALAHETTTTTRGVTR